MKEKAEFKIGDRVRYLSIFPRAWKLATVTWVQRNEWGRVSYDLADVITLHNIPQDFVRPLSAVERLGAIKT